MYGEWVETLTVDSGDSRTDDSVESRQRDYVQLLRHCNLRFIGPSAATPLTTCPDKFNCNLLVGTITTGRPPDWGSRLLETPNSRLRALCASWKEGDHVDSSSRGASPGLLNFERPTSPA
ncbi:hypothetical protein BDZ97DRAFT_1766443 [Flammula alnicola]|nr:hypothetical protein BDZ97DRAFT_1766443 [Flammula alnicola]